MAFFHAGCGAAALAGALLLTGCTSLGGSSLKHYQPEAFNASMYARHFLATPDRTCEAARRALLSQGYVVTDASTNQVSARKYFQPNADHHVQMEFRVVCVDEGDHQSIAFANALKDEYVVRKGKESASVGVGVLGSLSLPFQSGVDSLVKIGSQTVTNGDVYDRLFALMGGYITAVPARPQAAPVQERTPHEEAAKPAGNDKDAPL